MPVQLKQIAPITGAAFAEGSISGSKLTDGTVTGAKIADGTVTAADITDGTITLVDLAPGIVTKLSPANTNMAGATTVADGDLATAVTIAAAFKGQLWLAVNGILYRIGNGTKTGVSAYISGDGGATARAIDAVVSGDTIRWNGSVATFQIATSDVLDIVGQA